MSNAAKSRKQFFASRSEVSFRPIGGRSISSQHLAPAKSSVHSRASNRPPQPSSKTDRTLFSRAATLGFGEKDGNAVLTGSAERNLYVRYMLALPAQGCRPGTARRKTRVRQQQSLLLARERTVVEDGLAVYLRSALSVRKCEIVKPQMPSRPRTAAGQRRVDFSKTCSTYFSGVDTNRDILVGLRNAGDGRQGRIRLEERGLRSRSKTMSGEDIVAKLSRKDQCTQTKLKPKTVYDEGCWSAARERIIRIRVHRQSP